MLIELGHFAMVLALMMALVQAVCGLAGASLRRETLLAVVPSAVAGHALFLAFATGTLIHAFLTSDFSVQYVATNSNSALPAFYRVAALWGAHEGSLLLWIVVLCGWTVAVAWRSHKLPPLFAGRVLGVLGVISVGFLLFTLLTSNPFLRQPPALDGADLNPLLQDFAMAIHPPILYTGYVGFSVAFAFACATLLEGRKDSQWARWMRPWTILSWAFLSCGIALGSWWAYYELGWGGYWFWDAVENASFMPWLMGTALIHSLAVTDKRGLFRSWTLLLAIAAFSLSLLGTFLVRSGVLVSVHSFAADPERGIFILCFLGIMIGGALGLYAWRSPSLASNAGFEFLSRESYLLFNNILLVVACAVVLGGTLAPLVAEMLGLGELSVGKPYFGPSFMTPMVPMLALLGLGIHSSWRRGPLRTPRATLWRTVALALLFGAAIAYGCFHSTHLKTYVGTALGGWLICSSLIEPVARLRQRQPLTAATWGMTLAHLGVACFVLGVSLVEMETVERDVALRAGQGTSLAGYEFRYVGGENIQGPNYEGFRGHVDISRNGKLIAQLSPEKRNYWVRGQVMTEAGISSGLHRDLFVALGEELGGGAWSVRLQYRPMIRFIWLGALIMALGGVTTLFDRRYRQATGADSIAGTATAAGRAASP
jgi:cytochrome c-type biogenesis protein CcmF